MGGFFNMFIYGQRLTSEDNICFSLYIFKLLLVIVFPPAGVWIDQHEKKYKNPNKIAMAFILTAMFYFPGLFYALNNVTF